MRALIQRVSRARVTIEGHASREIGAGVVVLLGVAKGDLPAAAASLAEKTAYLRIFNVHFDPRRHSAAQDLQPKMNVSLLDCGGAALVISQFTLYGEVRRGRRPCFDRAAPAALAEPLYEEYVRCLRALGVRVETGVFRAHMQVELMNDGPVTILIDSEKTSS